MKTFLLIPIFFLSVISSIQAQTDSLILKNTYRIWISPIEKSKVKPWGFPSNKGQILHGVLYDVADSSIIISKTSHYSMDSQVKPDMTKMDVRSMDVIRIRKNGNTGQGILIGAISGLVLGGVVDLIYYSSWKNSATKETDNLGDAIANSVERSSRVFAICASLIGCIGTGIGIGAAVGSAKITIPINGNQAQFEQNKSRLTGYSVKHNPGFVEKTFSKLRDSVVDIDGNVYHLVALGAQVWMAENLKVTHFSDGSEISGVSGNVPGSGNLYNWVAVSDSRKLCPAGWHVPFLTEWNSLFSSLDMQNGQGSKPDASFSAMDKVCQWWSSTEQDAKQAKSIYLNNVTNVVMFTDNEKTSGFSVRCIRDF